MKEVLKKFLINRRQKNALCTSNAIANEGMRVH